MARPPSGPRVNGAAIRVIRQRSDMTLADLTAACRVQGVEIGDNYLTKIERGERHPSPKLLTALARALKVPKIALCADPDATEAVSTPASNLTSQERLSPGRSSGSEVHRSSTDTSKRAAS